MIPSVVVTVISEVSQREKVIVAVTVFKSGSVFESEKDSSSSSGSDSVRVSDSVCVSDIQCDCVCVFSFFGVGY